MRHRSTASIPMDRLSRILRGERRLPRRCAQAPSHQVRRQPNRFGLAQSHQVRLLCPTHSSHRTGRLPNTGHRQQIRTYDRAQSQNWTRRSSARIVPACAAMRQRLRSLWMSVQRRHRCRRARCREVYRSLGLPRGHSSTWIWTSWILQWIRRRWLPAAAAAGSRGGRLLR